MDNARLFPCLPPPWWQRIYGLAQATLAATRAGEFDQSRQLLFDLEVKIAADEAVIPEGVAVEVAGAVLHAVLATTLLSEVLGSTTRLALLYLDEEGIRQVIAQIGDGWVFHANGPAIRRTADCVVACATAQCLPRLASLQVEYYRSVTDESRS